MSVVDALRFERNGGPVDRTPVPGRAPTVLRSALLATALGSLVACSTEDTSAGPRDASDAAVSTSVTDDAGIPVEGTNTDASHGNLDSTFDTSSGPGTSTSVGETSAAGCDTCVPDTGDVSTAASSVETGDVVGTSSSDHDDTSSSPTTGDADSSSSSAGSSSSSGESSTDVPPVDPWQLADEFFSATDIAHIALTLSEEAITSLRSDSQTYVKGDLRVVLADSSETTFADVGVRLKGRLGSARTLDQKAAFLLKTNEFSKGKRLFGMTKLALNNLVQDASMVHEQLAYELFRAMGVPAPRTGYARVTLNGELMGLYATIEAVDNASFLNHWFGDDEGNLYEGAYGSDLEVPLLTSFDQDRGDDVGFSDLLELTNALDALAQPDQFVAHVTPYVDVQEYVRFAATELFVSHWDGYAATRNNYFVYRPPGGRWAWMPWGTDQTLVDTGYPLWRGGGRLQQLCYQSLECRLELADAYADLIGLVTQLGLTNRVNQLEALISEAATEDPRKEYDVSLVHDALDQLRGYLRSRPSVVASELFCTDPRNVDEDGDGASGCDVDCNDANAEVRPGNAELCNVRDDDCDGQIDEDNECPRCTEHDDLSGNRFAFCFDRLNYDEARQDCVARGGDLASIHGPEQQEWLSSMVASLNVGTDWWIGLDDRGYEGLFEWQDGSVFDYSYWAAGEPNDWGDNEDCAHLAWGSQWNDLPCGNPIMYICAVPATTL